MGFVCSALAGYSSANNRGRLHTISPAKASVPTDEKQGCCTKDFDKPHLLAASYYSVKDNLTATLMLNNKGPEPVEVKPTLFSITGERLEVPAVIVAGESFRNIDLRELGALPGLFSNTVVFSYFISVQIWSSARNFTWSMRPAALASTKN